MKAHWLGGAAGMLVSIYGAVAIGQEAPPVAPADPATCQGVLSQPARLPGVLSGVSRYGSTYVLVVPQRLAESVPNGSSSNVAGLNVGVQSAGAGADVARALGISKVQTYAADDSVTKVLQDVKDSKLDAAILWAPLAAAGIIELGMDADVSMYSVDRPHPGPASMKAASGSDPCSQAILEELDVSGVLPAELLVPVDVREVLRTRHVPPFDVGQARQGRQVFNQVCARCHGADAVADPHGLAPVDLRISITRFSFGGFNYIVLNGRPSKSMPPFRGTVTDDQISLIYQYLKARSKNILPAAASAAPGGKSQTEVPKQ